MRTKLFLIFSFWTLIGWGQTETVKIHRDEQHFFRGTTAELHNWILVAEGGSYFLFNVALTDDQVEDWFMRFRDSQNIYKSSEINPLTIVFEKENDAADRLIFYYSRSPEGELYLTLVSTMQQFCFREVIF